MSVISGPLYKEVSDLQRRPVIAIPVITSPETGSSGVSTSLAAECTSMYSVYRTDIDEAQWQLSTSSSFGSGDIVDEQIKTDSFYTYDYSLDPETSYNLRVRFKDNKGFYSDWSVPVSFSTGAVIVVTPTNVFPEDGATEIMDSTVLEISPFEVDGIGEGDYAHIQSQFRVYKVSSGDLIYDSGEIDATIDHELPSGTLEDDETEYEWEARVRDENYGWSGWSVRTSFVTRESFLPDDYIEEDGSDLDGLGAGDLNYDFNTDTGFFGEVSSSTLFTGDELASEIGLSDGTSQHSSDPWLKFYVGSNASCNRNNGVPYILYVAKKPYRYSVGWDQIDARDAVYNDERQVSKGDLVFNVRLLTGAEADPTSHPESNTTDPEEGEGSEWNELIYRVHTAVPFRQTGDNWETYSDADIIVGSGDGRYTWCQETFSVNTVRRVCRGNFTISRFNRVDSSSAAHPFYGWRPALQLRP